MRLRSTLLGVSACTALIAALVWDWATPDFWETGQLLGSVLLVGVLAGLCVYTVAPAD